MEIGMHVDFYPYLFSIKRFKVANKMYIYMSLIILRFLLSNLNYLYQNIHLFHLSFIIHIN